MTAAIRIRNY